MKTGIELITEERQRQVEAEGWTPGHDDAHRKGQMAGAAAVYALESCGFENPHCIELKREDVTHKVRLWPWAEHSRPGKLTERDLDAHIAAKSTAPRIPRSRAMPSLMAAAPRSHPAA